MNEITSEGAAQAFSGKTILISGASRGLGLLLAREFGREGGRIAICARRGDELKRASDWLRVYGVEALVLECDVGQEEAVSAMISQVRSGLGPIDVLVNCAGIIQVGPLESMGLADFRTALDVMYWGVVYPALAVLPEMKARGSGMIVNITSIGGKVSVPHLLPYSSAKAAAVAFSEGLRAEVHSNGIGVVTVVPGLMRTGSHVHSIFKGNRQTEFTWFSLGATLPVISMDAERAARRIVRAAKNDEAELILSIPANILARFHGLFPGVTANALSLVERFILPRPSKESKGMAGWRVENRLQSALLGRVTYLGKSAAHRFNQLRE